MIVGFQELFQLFLSACVYAQHRTGLFPSYEFPFHSQPIVRHFFSAIIVDLLSPYPSLLLLQVPGNLCLSFQPWYDSDYGQVGMNYFNQLFSIRILVNVQILIGKVEWNELPFLLIRWMLESFHGFIEVLNLKCGWIDIQKMHIGYILVGVVLEGWAVSDLRRRSLLLLLFLLNNTHLFLFGKLLLILFFIQVVIFILHKQSLTGP